MTRNQNEVRDLMFHEDEVGGIHAKGAANVIVLRH